MSAFPSPDLASLRASVSWGQSDVLYIAWRIPTAPQLSVRAVTVWSFVTGSGWESRPLRKSRIQAIPSSRLWPTGQFASVTQSSTYAWVAISKPLACPVARSWAVRSGGTGPSRTNRPIWVGNRPAYVAPRKVPYEAPR